MNGVVEYLKGSLYEFQHNVEWPKRSDLTSSATVIAISTVILALFTFGIDNAFGYSIKGIYTILNKFF